MAEPGYKAMIITTAFTGVSITLDDAVSGLIDYQKQNYFYYELISNDPATHEGTSARIVEYVYQSDAGLPRYRCIGLFMVINEIRYSVELIVTPPTDYESYSHLFPKIMSSFHVP